MCLENKIAILCPCANSVEPRALQSAMALATNAGKHFNVEFTGITERMLIHTARNVLAEGFLQTDCEWAFWLDSDMFLPPNTIKVMMDWAKKLDAKFLTGIYYQRMGEHRPVIGIRADDKIDFKDEYSTVPATPSENFKTPFKIDACGFGCVLLHREVLEKMKMPYFMNGLTTSGIEYSEDYYFCREARKRDIDIWAIPELQCGHIGQAPIIFAKDCKMSGVEYKDIKLYDKA